MDKLTQLWIRACKSNDPQTRIKSLQDRFYFLKGCSVYERQKWAISTLCEIVDTYCPIKARDIIYSLDDTNKSFYQDERSYRERAVDMLISRIRLTKVCKFDGLSTPRRFK